MVIDYLMLCMEHRLGKMSFSTSTLITVHVSQNTIDVKPFLNKDPCDGKFLLVGGNHHLWIGQL